MTNKEVERVAKVIFLPEDTEIVTLTITRKIDYTPEEIAQLEKYEPSYIQVHTSCFDMNELDGYDAMTGNGFILDENDEWHLINSEEEIREESKEQKEE